MRLHYLAPLLLSLLAPSLLNAQNRNVSIERAPAWVTPVAFDATAVPVAGQEAGFYVLLIDEQQNIPREENYVHIAYKLLTTEGVQTMSDLSFDFDPSYQNFILHHISIHRDGQAIDKIPRADAIRTIQREQSMDRYLYDGSLTAIINLTDVRVGDIVEYAYTRKGENPVYEGHIGRKIYFSYNFAYEKLFERLIVPPSPLLNLKYRNADVKPEIKTTSAGKEYIWTQKKTNAYVADNNLPDWYDGSQSVMVTNYDRWAEVASWASRHFRVSDAERQTLKERMTDRFETADKRKFAVEAIRFVQDEVRYLGFEAGLNSHKPHPPLKVFDQRFGDCKDKSLLLCSMLNTAGIEAYPVLVNTVLRDKIQNDVPAISAFNHCVVQIKLDDAVHYVDPTINNQGGTLGSIAFPPYGKGLIIREGTTELEQLFSNGVSEITETQTIAIPDLEGEAYLQVTTTYTGGEADYMRSEFLSNNAETIQKNYVAYYGNLYADIESLNPIAHHDNRRDNIFTVEENYRIPAFWKPVASDEDLLYTEMYPQALQNYFNVTKSSQRTTPYRLQTPLTYHHTFNIKLPMEWGVTPDEAYIDNDYYHYEYYVRHAGKEINIETHYRTKQDHVPPDAFARFVSDHEKMFNNLTFQLSYNKNIAGNEKGISWLGIISALVSMGFGLWIALRLYYYYDPQPATSVSQYDSIGGWLILVAIGLIFSPFRIIYDLFQLPEVYDSQMWANLIALNRYDLFGFMLVTHVYNIVFLIYAVLILVLFIRRRSSLPRLITIYFAVNCFMTVTDSLIGAALDPSLVNQPDHYRNMFSAVFGAAIWIPYFNMSSRVKETFVKRVDDNDDDTEYALASGVAETDSTNNQHR